MKTLRYNLEFQNLSKVIESEEANLTKSSYYGLLHFYHHDINFDLTGQLYTTKLLKKCFNNSKFKSMKKCCEYIFWNFMLALFFITLPFTIAYAERSFSKNKVD